MENLIYFMETMNITQEEYNSFSHKKLFAIDSAGKDSGIENAFAPCMVKVLSKFPFESTGFSNTVIYGSCDINGNPAKVRLSNGYEEIICIALTHNNDISNISINRIYKSGEVFYKEGTKGHATGNHIHCEIALGWQYKKVKGSDGTWRLPNSRSFHGTFFLLRNWNKIKDKSIYEFEWVDSRIYSDNNLKLAMEAFNIVAGKKVATPEDIKNLDTNNNGKIELNDAMKHFNKAAGKE